MTKENEDKKKWLKRYRRAKRNLIVTELAVKELKAAQIMGAKGNDGMPKGKNNSSDLSDYIVKLEDKEKEYEKAKESYIKICDEIISAIYLLPDSRQQMVLIYRYITSDNNDWSEVLIKMREAGEVYSMRQIYNIHGEALRNLKIS